MEGPNWPAIACAAAGSDSSKSRKPVRVAAWSVVGGVGVVVDKDWKEGVFEVEK